MSFLLQHRFRIISGLALCAALYLAAMQFSSGVDAMEHVASFTGLGWLVVLSLSLVNYGLRYVRWDLFLRSQREATPGMLVGMTAYMAGFALTTTPGKIGEAYRCVLLDEVGTSYTVTLTTCLLERILDLLVIVIMTSLILSAINVPLLWISILSAGIVLAFLALLWVARVRPNIDEKTSRTLFSGRWTRFLNQTWSRIAAALANIMSTRLLSIGFGLGLVAWIAEGVGLALILQIFDTPLGWTLPVAVYAASMLVGALSLLPGGVGSSEATMVLLLTQFGVPLETAIAATFICRAATLWFAVLLGLLSIPAFRFFSKSERVSAEALSTEAD